MEAETPVAANPKEVEKVIVAVHGIGDQKRFATIRQVLTQFGIYHGRPVAVPLGRFHSANAPEILTVPELPHLAFAEIYWADIPRDVVKREHDLEDTKPWVKTIIGRAQRENRLPQDMTAKDYRMLEQVLGEMLQTIGVLDRLFFLTDKMGLFSFDLKRVLENYLGDVQIVADFKREGTDIGARFAKRMEEIQKTFPNAEIYLVAHSEGTVVSFLGLLSALCRDEDGWIGKVRGYMTIGSPIDKHLALWPELFAAFQAPAPRWRQAKIPWRNYYDYGDPVGFELDAARRRFTAGEWEGVFAFPKEHDHGFTRYALPGKAHNDYWQDEEVFGHFLQTVVKEEIAPDSSRAGRNFEKAPATKPLAWALSWITPYLGALALLFGAVFLLYRVVTGASSADSLVADWAKDNLPNVFAITFLIAGLTVFARIPRLTRLLRWKVIGFLIFALGVVAYLALTGQLRSWRIEDLKDLSSLVVIALVVGAASWLAPTWGMSGLLIPGALGVAYAIYLHVPPGSLRDLWPILLAAAVFLYAWWLVALIFDLVFVWHRYIRGARKAKLLWKYPETPAQRSPAGSLAAPTP